MEDSFESQFDPELIALVRHYEEMIGHKEHHFFDVFEYEDIIDYYLYLSDLPSALVCLKKALRQHQNNPLIQLKQVQYYIRTKNEHEKDQVQACRRMPALRCGAVPRARPPCL